MESRFNKYKTDNKVIASHIANVNNFVDFMYNSGLNIIESEIKSLQSYIDKGTAPTIFSNKINKLINLGEAVEKVYEIYHFNKEDAA